MTLDEVTGLIAALTALAIAVGGVIAAVKVLAEVRLGNDKTDVVHTQLNSQKRAADQRDEQLRTLLQNAGIDIPPDPNLKGR
jgi:hypothetical protein